MNLKFFTKHTASLALMGLLLLGFGVIIFALLSSPPQTRKTAPPRQAPLVDTMTLIPETVPLFVTALGSVKATNLIDIKPQVGGRIVAIHENFEPGGIIRAGETVILIERQEYELAIIQAQAALSRTNAAVALEKGRQIVAKAEYDLLPQDMVHDIRTTSLALRKPQLQQVMAEQAAARAHLKKAQLDLARTAVTFPFDIVILGVATVEGEIISAREPAGQVARADTFWVEAHLPQEKLAKLRPKNKEMSGSAATITSSNGVTYTGEVIRIRPKLSESTRLGSAIIAVTDPLSRLPENTSRAPLLIGSYVSSTIDAGHMENVVRLPRRVMQDNGSVFVADSAAQLAERVLTILWENSEALLVHIHDFHSGDRLIYSRISGTPPGTALDVRTGNPFAIGEKTVPLTPADAMTARQDQSG